MKVTSRSEASADWLAMADGAGSFYHHPRWIEHIRDCFGFDTSFLEARDSDGALTGILALAEVPAFPGLAPRRLVSFPFSYASGVLCDKEQARSALLREARNSATARGVGLVEIKQCDDLGTCGDGYSRLKKYSTFLVPTDNGIDEVWGKLNASSTRRGIRKGEKSGLVVEHADTVNAWKEMHSLQLATSATHGVPAPPLNFFTVHCRELQQHGLTDLYLARKTGSGNGGGQAVAGVVVWKGKKRWIYAFGASRKDALKQRPNHLLIWNAMRDAAEARVVFDLGRAAPEQKSLVEFKMRWGGLPVPLAYDYWPQPAGLNARMRTEGRLGIGARFWARLPAGLTAAASPLYRYLG